MVVVIKAAAAVFQKKQNIKRIWRAKLLKVHAPFSLPKLLKINSTEHFLVHQIRVQKN